MADNFDNLNWTDGLTSVPGIYPDVYYIPKSKITTWPALPASPASAADEVTYAGDFVIETSATWKKINVVDVKSQPTAEPQGEIRCMSFNNKMKLVTTLTSEAATAFAKIANNTDLVYLFRERDSGKWRLCGSEKFTTNTKVTLDEGADPTGERGTTIEVESTDTIPFPFYDGAITTDDGDINPST